MGKAKRKRRAVLADRPALSPGFEHAEAMAGEGNARIVVIRRVRTIDQLFRRGKLTRQQMAGLEAYHAAFLEARLDGGRSCLAVGFGGTVDPRPHRVLIARNLERNMRASIPPSCLGSVDAVVIGGMSITLHASARVPAAIGNTGAMARVRRSVRKDHTDAVVAELAMAGYALALVARIAA